MAHVPPNQNAAARAVTVIAEAGVNHNGKVELALALIDAAADAGADIVKFQTFSTVHLAAPTAESSAYQIRNIGLQMSQREMLKPLELNEEAHEALLAHCEKKGIEFLSTPFDLPSLTLLVDNLGLRKVKVGSGDLTNAPMLLEIARRKTEVILSTGMATLQEIEEALGVLAFGFAGSDEPSPCNFKTAFANSEAKKALRDRVTLLHCTSDYPANIDEINLRAIDTLANVFELPVGFSDHSEGVIIAVAAVARGAVVLEKHLTLDRTFPGPDHRASIEPDEFASMVKAIRDVERALGHSRKGPTSSELKNIPAARKSLVARVPIKWGETFTADMLDIKRPGTGMAPINYWDCIGRRATRDYHADDLIGEKI